MFTKLRRIYPLKWDDQFKADSEAKTMAIIEQAMSEWAIGLHGLTGDQIKRGLDRCRTESEWPPSIALFVKFARSAADNWEHAGPAYRLHVKALPKPKANVDIVRGNLLAMRRALGRV